MAKGRYKPNVDHRHLVNNASSRNGAKPKLIVIHSTEGNNVPNSVRDLISLGHWFDNPKSKASSTVGVDDDGNSARYVRDEYKAWTQAYYNPWSLSIELVGKAAQSPNRWTKEQIKECARWIAYWCHLHDIRPYKASVTKDGRITKSGVIRHSELGYLGGNHRDPGTFPLAKCMTYARKYLKEYK